LCLARFLERSEQQDPDFYEVFEFTTTLPGESQLRISCWDWDGLGDDLIGHTVRDCDVPRACIVLAFVVDVVIVAVFVVVGIVVLGLGWGGERPYRSYCA